MQHEERANNPLPEVVTMLTVVELETVSGGDQVAHLPQSIHMDYGKLSINENPTRLA